MERDQHCPSCEADRTFGLTASTNTHLGEKAKWDCPECGYGFVTIGDAVDTSTA